jgi:hypothetical protein
MPLQPPLVTGVCTLIVPQRAILYEQGKTQNTESIKPWTSPGCNDGMLCMLLFFPSGSSPLSLYASTIFRTGFESWKLSV